MAGSTFGKQFKITTWGESHGKALGLFARTVLKPLYEVLYMFSRMSNGDMLNVTLLFV